jgi:iron(III) transport system substrate-binding protein
MILLLARRALLCLALLGVAVYPAVADDTDTKALYDAARKEGPMTWYISFYSQDLPARAAAAFAKAYPGLTVTPVRLTSGGIFQRLNQDLRNHVATASVFTTTGIGGQYEMLMRAGELMQYTPQAAAKLVPAAQPMITPGYVYPMGIGLMAIAYNTTKLTAADAPATWTALLDPKWKGKIAIGDPSFSGFDAAWDMTMVKRDGFTYFEQLAKNDPLVQRSTLDSLTALNAGERIVAALPDTIAIQSAAKGNPIAVVYPTDGTVELIGYTAILKTAPQPNTAKLFTEFLLSPEHAQIMVDEHLHSLRPEVTGALANGGKLTDIKLAPPVTTAESEKLLADLVERWRDLFAR